MSFSVSRSIASLGSRSRTLAGRSHQLGPALKGQTGRPARRPSKHIASLALFRSTVWEYWKKNGRHELPWRKTSDPYKILVSEVMLQQTQVDRVIPYYRKFLRAFPNTRALARASLEDVLKVWSGLGYNRRAKYLRDAAVEITKKHYGKIPAVYNELVELPGVGDYTAKAVRVFAFNDPEVLIETNIRTALIHHFYSSILQKTAIADTQILPFAGAAAEGQDPRKWHWALMDYGAHLKRSGVRNNHKNAHYVRQSKFEGSLRQKRGEILRTLNSGKTFNTRSQEYRAALASLSKDGLVVSKKGKWKIA